MSIYVLKEYFRGITVMRQCTICNNRLAMTTKGELCQTCYYQRNKIRNHNLVVIINDVMMDSFDKISLDNSTSGNNNNNTNNNLNDSNNLSDDKHSLDNSISGNYNNCTSNNNPNVSNNVSDDKASLDNSISGNTNNNTNNDLNHNNNNNVSQDGINDNNDVSILVNNNLSIADNNLFQLDMIENIPIESASEYIKSTINKLYEEIDFLREELRDKNLLIKTLIYRNANDGAKIDINDVISEDQSCFETTQYDLVEASCDDNSMHSSLSHTTEVNIVDYDDTDDYSNVQSELNSTRIRIPIEAQMRDYKNQQNDMFTKLQNIEKSEVESRGHNVGIQTDIARTIDASADDTVSTDISSDNNSSVSTQALINERFEWKKVLLAR